MFEEPDTSRNSSAPQVQGATGATHFPVRVLAPEGEPTEFLYKGRRFHIHAIVSRWRESGGWWNRIDDGNHRGRNAADEFSIFDDGARAIWRVEAAPEGAMTTFEIERDEITGTWLIRPTSRPL